MSPGKKTAFYDIFSEGAKVKIKYLLFICIWIETELAKLLETGILDKSARRIVSLGIPFPFWTLSTA